jgi:hypothetical protein
MFNKEKIPPKLLVQNCLVIFGLITIPWCIILLVVWLLFVG